MCADGRAEGIRSDFERSHGAKGISIEKDIAENGRGDDSHHEEDRQENFEQS